MQAYIRNDARTRYLPTSGLSELVKDIAHLCLTYKPAEVLVNLSDNDLTLTSVQELVELLDKNKDIHGTLALDLSLNRVSELGGDCSFDSHPAQKTACSVS